MSPILDVYVEVFCHGLLDGSREYHWTSQNLIGYRIRRAIHTISVYGQARITPSKKRWKNFIRKGIAIEEALTYMDRTVSDCMAGRFEWWNADMMRRLPR